MTGFAGGRRTQSRGKVAAFFCLCVVLISIHLRLSAAVYDNASLPPRARRIRFLDLSPLPVVSSVATLGVTKGHRDVLFAEDKRKIHTGPNPLHNK
uniref:CLAVATA3/ESR (CLE)-related protein 17-like n=1 Tax=Nelumbo nucifera TaxID=4432 RepID=A0A822YT77_NELNU|nr:TPA_asm: hypothetical protein HUJ06_006340 [Nelumbo nucifera]